MEESSDTTAMQARHGKDIQGIPWDRLLFTRDKYRKTRLEQYSYYHLMNKARIELLRECKKTRSGANFFEFQYNTRSVNSTLGHFKDLNRRVVHREKIPHCEKAITNCIEICDSPNGASHLLISNSDSVVRVVDADKFAVLSQNTYPWSVNHTSLSPDKKQLVAVGDHADALLVDHHNGKVITTVKGHLDNSFAAAWNPDGRYFATGSRDMTCQIWDVRNPTSACVVLAGRMGPIQSLRFSPDGRFLAMAEQADFVHLFNVDNDYSESQELDIFGEISGISFSPDSEALFVGVADRAYGSLLEYTRCHFHNYLYSMW